jgi:FixJ family two-component response regulator
MTASLAHELNQPLAAIVNNATAALQYLEQGRLDSKQLQEILTDVVGDGHRAYDIMRNVRGAIKKGSAIRGPLSLNNVVNAVTRMVQPDAAAQFCKVETFLVPDLDAAQYDTELFKSASEFLSRSAHPGPSCVIVDVRMPGLNGIDFQNVLIENQREEQLIFITGHGDIPMCAQAMKAGAVDFLPKPFKPKQLMESVERALTRSTEQRRRASEKHHAGALLDRLTPREYQVMQLVATGMLNKQVGGELGMAEKTVKTHRAHVMQKLHITSVAELMRVLQEADVPPVARPGTKV